jgi:hypothetical protein
MSHHPVVLRIGPSPHHRLQVAVRLVLLLAIASAGCSSAYWILYLAIPAVVAVVCSQDGDDEYLRTRATPTLRVLGWLAGAYAYLWLLTDEAPRSDGQGPVQLDVTVQGHPTPASALARLLTSLPALLLLCLLSLVAIPLWVIGAASILATEEVPRFVGDFLTLKLTYQFRLVAYHLSLVEAYPSLADAPLQAERPRAV